VRGTVLERNERTEFLRLKFLDALADILREHEIEKNSQLVVVIRGDCALTRIGLAALSGIV
jgi:hypothetical protein